jgi:hypothetical protein
MIKTILGILLLCQLAVAADVNLSWNANTESDLAGYKVHYGAATGNYPTNQSVGNVTSFTLNLAPGTYFFAVTALDTSGNESGYSNEVTTTISLPPPPSGAGMVAAYNFDEGSGAVLVDLSGNSNPASLFGSPSWVVSGKHAGGLSFNGTSQYGIIANQPLLNLTNNFTLSCWVFPISANATRGIISKATTGDAGFQLAFDTSGYVRWPKYTGSGTAISNGALPIGIWSYLTAVTSAGVNKLYINGILQTQVGNLVIPSNSLPIALASLYPTSPSFFANIILDDVRIYNRVLTDAEILADMNVGAAPPPDTTAPAPPTNLRFP